LCYWNYSGEWGPMLVSRALSEEQSRRWLRIRNAEENIWMWVVAVPCSSPSADSCRGRFS
jgi:hypothetical protein